LLSDVEILQRAYEKENDTRDRRPAYIRSWEYFNIGASHKDVKRLLDEGMLLVSHRSQGVTRYRLSDKGRELIWALNMEREFTRVPASSVMEAMELVVGFDDLKESIAYAVESRRRTHFLLEGPPACAKSLMLEAVRSAVPGAYPAAGSRTSAAGISQVLFEHQPSVLLLDEADKIDNDVYAVLLGLMENGEILETKSGKTRGIVLNTMVIAACNSSAKMTAEFLSRFALHPHFPRYTREEFIKVCRGFLSRAEGCPPDLATLIGRYIYDNEIGDVRKARGVWNLMRAPTEEEVARIIRLMLKYRQPEEYDNGRQRKKKTADRLPGI